LRVSLASLTLHPPSPPHAHALFSETVIADGARRLWFVEIAPNDGIFGVFSIGGPSTREISEDDGSLSVTTISVDRVVGTVGNVRVTWAIRSSTSPTVPSPAINFLLMGASQGAFTSDAGRPQSTLPAYNFNGVSTFISLTNTDAMVPLSQLAGNWTMSFRMLQRDGNFGYLWGVWGGTDANPEGVAVVRSSANGAGNRLTFTYRTLNTQGQAQQVQLVFPYPFAVVGAQWRHVTLTREAQADGNSYYTMYFDGARVSTSTPQGPINPTASPSAMVSFIGRARDSFQSSFFNGLMQEAVFFTECLSAAQVAELASPAADLDIVPAAGVVTFANNQAVSNFTLSAVNDTIPEVDESFTVMLMTASDGGILGTPRTTEVVIASSDNPNGRFVIANDSLTVVEGSTAVFQLERLDGSLGAVTVNWVVSFCRFCDASAYVECQPCATGSEASDLSVLSGSLLFADGQRWRNITINVLSDGRAEFREIFTIDLTGATGGARLDSTRATAQLTVPQNGFPYGQVFLQRVGGGSARAFTVNEGDIIMFNAVRYGALYGNISVDWIAVLGNATTADITPLRGNVILRDGLSSAQFNVTVVDDTDPELAKTFSVRIPPTSQQTGLAEIDTTTILTNVDFTIAENDVPYGTFGFVNRTFTIDETGVVVYFVERLPGRLSDATVQWQVAGVNASTQLDQTSGTLSFVTGQQFASFTLRPIDDGNDPERKRTFSITLTAPTGGAIISVDRANATLNLMSENDPHGVFSIEAASSVPVDEPVNGTVTVEFIIRRAAGLFGRVDVFYESASGTATSGADFAPVSGVVQFAEGQSTASVFVNVLADTVPEVVETGYMLVTGAVVVPADSQAPFAQGATSPRVAIGTASVAAFTITANDYANGVFYVFRVSPTVVQEGQVATFMINRMAGTFGTVDVRWTVPSPVGNFTAGDINATVGDVSFIHLFLIASASWATTCTNS
jgi:hypothetical protein